MKISFIVLIMLGILTMACSTTPENPFFTEYDTPFGVAPFSEITDDHYMPAFLEGIKQVEQEVDVIVSNTEEPTFENTVEALEFAGEQLNKVSNVFYNLTSAHTNDSLQKISTDIAPLTSKLNDDINLNPELFAKVKAVYEKKDELNLNTEQKMLLDEAYKGFVRGGANLNEADQAKLREINSELAVLTIKFGENVLKEDNNFTLVLENEDDLAGLPDFLIEGAAAKAKDMDQEGKWVFTVHKPVLLPFLTYSEKREYREQMLKAYITRGDHGDEFDNKANLSKIAALRVNKAKLLGYETHAHFVLEENMAKTPDKVYELLNQLWEPALVMSKKEASDLQEMARKEGNSFKIEAWDWWYYAEKLKKEKYALDDEQLKPYFSLESAREGAFMVANKLFGLTFEERMDIPTYHPDVRTFEVKNPDGSHQGLFFADYFTRSSKRGGAWMNSYRKQSRKDGENITPIIVNVLNFNKPSEGEEALLTFEEVNTLFHEFGHALHGLLSDCNYLSLSGTSVPRDFVELPSQIMENWAAEPEVMKIYAKHYETGEPIPDELIEKIKNAGHFNQGFVTVEYLAASYLDMDWHTLTAAVEHDPTTFETNALNKIGLIPEIVVRYRSTYFNHIFSGGYSSGYYSYIWSEVLDSDAYEAFKETNVFDKNTAASFRENILARGGTEDPMTLYLRFRGKEPSIESLLKKRGLK
ncbi:M3 family metallopeptidase [candidate division KSB1 bacterium]